MGINNSIIKSTMNQKAEMMTAWNVGYYWEFEEFEEAKPIIEVFNFDDAEEVFKHQIEIINKLELHGIGKDKVDVNSYIFSSGCYRIEMCFDFGDIKETEFIFMIDMLKEYGLPEYPVRK